MNVLIPNNFNDGYLMKENGTASVSTRENGKIANIKSDAGENSAQFVYEAPISNGDIIEFEVYARLLKGQSRVSLNFYNKNMDVTHTGYIWVDVKGNEFKKYNIKTVVPFDKEVYRVEIVMGSWKSLEYETEAEYMKPKLNINSSYGSLQTMAFGLLRINNGVVEVNNNFKYMGIENLEYNESTKKITVTIHAINRWPGMRPLIFVSGATENKYYPLAGELDQGTRSFDIALSNGTDLVSLETGNYLIFFEVKG